MIKNKKFIFVLALALLITLVASYFLTKQPTPKTLKSGDKDPETGCTVTTNGGALCN